MSTIAEHHAALKAALETIDGLRCYATPTFASNPPYAFPQLSEWEPTSMARKGHKRYLYDVYIFTAETARPQDGYTRLMEYADSGPKSIDLAIWDANDRAAGTFGGLASTTAFVQNLRVLGTEEVDAFQMYGGVFTVEVHTKG